MSSIICSQGVVLATAMVVSSTVLYLAFNKQIPFPQLSKSHDSRPPSPSLRPCLCSEGKMKKRDKKKKKRVQFAENVKDTKGNGEEYRREKQISMLAKQQREKPTAGVGRPCRDEIHGGVHGMPANRIALYNGILKDRVHRIECSY